MVFVFKILVTNYQSFLISLWSIFPLKFRNQETRQPQSTPACVHLELKREREREREVSEKCNPFFLSLLRAEIARTQNFLWTNFVSAVNDRDEKHFHLQERARGRAGERVARAEDQLVDGTGGITTYRVSRRRLEQRRSPTQHCAISIIRMWGNNKLLDWK